jgi:hypothetical protein
MSRAALLMNRVITLKQLSIFRLKGYCALTVNSSTAVDNAAAGFFAFILEEKLCAIYAKGTGLNFVSSI